MYRFIFLVVLASFLLAPMALAVSWWPLVPCGLNQQPAGIPKEERDYTLACNKCQLLQLLDNLVDFVFFGIAPILGTLFIVWAGARIITAGGFPAQLSEGKRMFWQVITAWIVLGLAWLGTNTLILSLVGDQEARVFGGKPWSDFTCTVVVPTPYVFPSPTPTVPGASPTQTVGPLPPGQIDACAQCGAYRTGVTAGGQPPVCVGPYVNMNQPLNNTSTTCPFAVAAIATKLDTLRGANSAWVVSEGFPPTINHSDPGHGNGTVVDIALRPAMSGTPTQADVQRLAGLCAAAQQAGFRILNEYTNIPQNLYQFLGTCPQPRSFQNTNGPHLHLNL